MSREFDAPPEKVFRAFTDKDLFGRWVGPRRSALGSIVGTPPRAGTTATPPVRDGEEIATFYGSFHEVRSNERIVQTFTWEGAPDGVSLETMSFVDLGDGRTRIESVSVVDSLERAT